MTTRTGSKAARKRSQHQSDKHRLGSTRERAKHHSRTRDAHARELAEDYVEAIAELIDQHGEARVVDLAELLGVSHVTVIRTVGRLTKGGLVSTEPYRSIFLTPTGLRLAKQSQHRHEVVVNFLLALGVSEENARADAEGIEHHVSSESLRAFERFTRQRKRPT